MLDNCYKNMVTKIVVGCIMGSMEGKDPILITL